MVLTKLGRNDLCYCESGKKYKKCCLDEDREAKIARVSDKLRKEYGIYINYISPVEWQGAMAWTIGTRVYPNRPPKETFHEFLIHVLRQTLGELWRAEQAELPEEQRHFALKCSNEYEKWKAANADAEMIESEGRFVAYPNGWVQYFISLAWDVATLIHTSNLSDSFVDRLRNPWEFQGARYEVAIAAIFARLNCEIRFLNDDEHLYGHKHAEFVATHRPSGQQLAVETKSRRRSGVINEGGMSDPEDPLHGDPRAVRRRFMEALDQAPEGLPFIIFIDINAPLQPESEGLAKMWIKDIRRWMSRLPLPTAEKPAAYNALYVTNFAAHYEGEALARGGEWVLVQQLFTCHPLTIDLTRMLDHALNNYHRVPKITEGGTILD